MSSLCRKNEKQGGIVYLPQWKFQICKFKSKKKILPLFSKIQAKL